MHERKRVAYETRVGVREQAGDATWPRYQPWLALALFSLLVNFAWEVLVPPFYALHAAAPHSITVLACLRSSFGDAGITIASYAAVAAIGTRRWINDATPRMIAGYLACGVGATIALEYISVYRLSRWSYSSIMPTIGGIGVVPLVQWLVLPLVVLWLTHRHLAGASAVQSSRR